jgi:hypothetical protein
MLDVYASDLILRFLAFDLIASGYVVAMYNVISDFPDDVELFPQGRNNVGSPEYSGPCLALEFLLK